MMTDNKQKMRIIGNMLFWGGFFYALLSGYVLYSEMTKPRIYGQAQLSSSQSGLLIGFVSMWIGGAFYNYYKNKLANENLFENRKTDFELEDNLFIHQKIWFAITMMIVSIVYTDTTKGLFSQLNLPISENIARSLVAFALFAPWLPFMNAAAKVKTLFYKYFPTKPINQDFIFFTAYISLFTGFSKHMKASILAFKSDKSLGFMSGLAYFYPLLVSIGWIIFTAYFKI